MALNQIPKKIPFSLRPKRLSWLDFTGEVKPDHTFWAYTTWKISYRYEPKIYSDKIELKVTVNPYLDKNNSYVREEKKSGELLMHEQQHYNIGCLCAMDFKKRCDNFKFTLAFYKGQIKRLFDESLNEYLKFEKEYDIETDHFRNKEMQKQWEIIIRDALFNYKEFW